MYSRSLTDKIKMQIEIMMESIMDFVSQNSLRKPLLMLAGVAVFMTLRNARHSVAMIKKQGLSSFGRGSPYTTSSSLSMARPGAGAYGAGTAGAYGATGTTGVAYGATNQINRYGQQQQMQQQPQQAFGSTNYGGNRGLTPPAAGSTNYGVNRGFTPQASQGGYNTGVGGNLRGTAAAGGMVGGMANTMGGASAFSTQNLIAKYGASVQSVPQGLLQNFGSVPTFSGQIETISAADSPGFVQQTLQTPGAGKVLVVDCTANMNSGVFDSSMVPLAQQNGWAGVIINGPVVNGQMLQATQFGVKALGSSPQRGMQYMGQRGAFVNIGGVAFNPGSYVYADISGVVVSQTNLIGTGGAMPGQFGGTIGMAGVAGGMAQAGGMYNGGMAQQQQGMAQQQQGMANQQQGMANQQQGMANQQQGMANQQFGMKPNTMSQFPNTAAGGGYGRPATGTYGATTTASRYGVGTTAASPITQARSRPALLGGSSSSRYGRSSFGSSYRRKKPSKKTLMAMLLFICAIAWVLMGE